MVTSIDDKCDEYRSKFLKLEREQPELYQRIRFYANSCMRMYQYDKNGTKIKPDPINDIQYLEIELQGLISKYPEYNNISHEFYKRMRRIVDNNNGAKND